MATTESTMTTRDSLLSEEPKIDSALKSFVSFWIANFALQQETPQPSPAPPAATLGQPQPSGGVAADSNTALACTRSLSKAINAHVMAIGAPPQKKNNNGQINNSNGNTQEEKELVERVWNELAAMPGTRITKSLGKTCLYHAWSNDLRDAAMAIFLQQQQQQQPSTKDDDENEDMDHESVMRGYLDFFEQLLLQPSNPDSTLIWSTVKGQQAELARRAAQRQESAQARVQEQEQAAKLAVQTALSTPTIEEVNEENGGDDKGS